MRRIVSTLNLEIVRYPSDYLTEPCDKVNEFTPFLHEVLDAMPAIMEKEGGMGLASNQVGIPFAFFIMKDKKGKITEFVNPEITEREGTIFEYEGCLSMPGVSLQIPRSQTVTVKAQDRNGVEFTVICQDFESICVQHEIEHLHGVFFLSKVSRQQRRAAMKKAGIKD